MKARIAGTDLEYEARGHGRTLLLLHAFPLNRTMWETQVSALATSHQVVRFDCRGFGGSPPGDALLTMEHIADDAAAILDRLGISQAVVGGCSMGGYAALAFARRYPDRLRGLVLLDTRAGADSEEGKKNRAVLAERVRREGAGAAAQALLPQLVGETTQREHPEVLARLRAIILGTPPRGIVDALAGLAARADSGPALKEIHVPTLVICGDEDTIIPLPEAEALQRGIAGSRLVVIPRAGHLANLEQPEAVNQALREFLATI